MQTMLKASDFNPREDAEQEAVFDWAAWSPEHRALKWLHHTPNGGSRNKAEAARFQRLGVKKGVADIFLPHPVGGYHGLWIELKRRKGGRLTEAQIDFLGDMRAEGYAAGVARGSDEAVSMIRAYLEGRWVQ